MGADQLSRFLNGKRTLKLPTVAKLCRELGLGLAPLGGPAAEAPKRPKKKGD